MLFLLIAWATLASGCLLIGLGILQVAQASGFDRPGDRLVLALWLGLVVLAGVLLSVSLVLPLSGWVGIGVFGGLCGWAIWSDRAVVTEWRAQVSRLGDRRWVGWLLAGAILLATFCTRPVTWLDTGLYHYGLVQWLAQFGTVSGLALLFPNFGFVSAWFALAAPTESVWPSQTTPMANGLIYGVLALQTAIAARRIWQEWDRSSDWLSVVFGAILLPYTLVSGLLSIILVSPSPDLALIFLVGVIAWTLLLLTESRASEPLTASSAASSAIVPLMLAAGTVTIKIIGLPLLGVSSGFYVLKTWQSGPSRGWQRVGVGTIVAIAVLLPFVAASILTSGCPLYPATIACTSLPWAPDPAQLQVVARNTHHWMTWYGDPPPGTQPILWFVQRWLAAENSNRWMALLLLLLPIALGGIGWTMRRRRQYGHLWVIAIGLTGTGFLLMTAPSARFGLSYLLVILASAIALLEPRRLVRFARQRLVNLPRRGWVGVGLAIATALLILGFQRAGGVQAFLPPPIRTVPTVVKQRSGFAYFSPQPEGALCWASPIPCAFEVPSDVRLRDPSQGLRSGFVRQP